MTENAINKLYNQLFTFEGKQVNAPYPIHKKFNPETFKFKHLYDWISKHNRIDKNTVILDAGCGVGFGSLFLAKLYGCKVTGISLSQKEIEAANKFAQQSEMNHLVDFQQKSFDEMPPNRFDLIIAVESLKHAIDLEKSINILKSALKPNGHFIVIDDFLRDSKSKDWVIETYKKDWCLTHCLNHNIKKFGFVKKEDFTEHIQPKKEYKLKILIGFCSAFKSIFKVLTIWRGAFLLEYLYSKKDMQYCVYEYQNKA